jgi:hypothetical protein
MGAASFPYEMNENEKKDEKWAIFKGISRRGRIRRAVVIVA